MSARGTAGADLGANLRGAAEPTARASRRRRRLSFDDSRRHHALGRAATIASTSAAVRPASTSKRGRVCTRRPTPWHPAQRSRDLEAAAGFPRGGAHPEPRVCRDARTRGRRVAPVARGGRGRASGAVRPRPRPITPGARRPCAPPSQGERRRLAPGLSQRAGARPLHWLLPGARSSGDRARASGARGRRFDSCRAHEAARCHPATA